VDHWWCLDDVTDDSNHSGGSSDERQEERGTIKMGALLGIGFAAMSPRGVSWDSERNLRGDEGDDAFSV